MSVRARLCVPIALLLAGLALPTASQASFHLMKVREVYPGASTTADDAYVELQMYSTGENHVAGHELQVFDMAGAMDDHPAFLADVPNGQTQSTILIGDSSVAGADLVDPNLEASINRAGGAVCWDASHIDCVSWGGFANPAMLATGNPFAGPIPDGMAIVRTIAPGCPTLLEPGDDSNDSATDFTAAAPSPRPNSTAPTEVACSGGGGGGGGGGDTQAPQTEITKGPKHRLDAHRTKVKFRSNELYSSFECKLDRQPYKRCHSPRKLKQLEDGRHKFKVRATDAAGNTDPTPAKLKFKVVS